MDQDRVASWMLVGRYITFSVATYLLAALSFAVRYPDIPIPWGVLCIYTLFICVPAYFLFRMMLGLTRNVGYAFLLTGVLHVSISVLMTLATYSSPASFAKSGNEYLFVEGSITSVGIAYMSVIMLIGFSLGALAFFALDIVLYLWRRQKRVGNGISAGTA
jgi:hypothetical protein